LQISNLTPKGGPPAALFLGVVILPNGQPQAARRFAASPGNLGLEGGIPSGFSTHVHSLPHPSRNPSFNLKTAVGVVAKRRFGL